MRIEHFGPPLKELHVPRRHGPRPETDGPFPHSQVSGQGPVHIGAQLLERVGKLRGVSIGDSLVSVPGALAFHLDESAASGPAAAFVRNHEFGHLHPPHDGSLHLMARPESICRYLENGWAEMHPDVPGLALVFGPRDENDLKVVWSLVEDTYRYACGD